MIKPARILNIFLFISIILSLSLLTFTNSSPSFAAEPCTFALISSDDNANTPQIEAIPNVSTITIALDGDAMGGVFEGYLIYIGNSDVSSFASPKENGTDTSYTLPAFSNAPGSTMAISVEMRIAVSAILTCTAEGPNVITYRSSGEDSDDGDGGNEEGDGDDGADDGGTGDDSSDGDGDEDEGGENTIP